MSHIRQTHCVLIKQSGLVSVYKMALSEPTKQGCIEYFVWFCRIWGIATALVLWGIGIEVIFTKEMVGYYIIAVAIVMSVFETVFLVHHLISECQGDLSQSCLRCWSFVLLIDDWRKALLYLLLSVFCLIRNFLLEGEAWLSVIAGSMVLMSSLFYVLKSLTNSRLHLPELSSQNSGNNTYNRLDRTSDELGSGGSIANEMPNQYGDTISIQSGAALISNAQDRSLAEQDGIMEA